MAVVALGAAGRVRVAARRAGPRADCADAVDTVTVLGTPFHGGLLHFLAENGYLGGRMDTLTTDGLIQALTFASRVSAITCSRAGREPAVGPRTPGTTIRMNRAVYAQPRGDTPPLLDLIDEAQVVF